jgi:hypothetical protein
MNSQRKNGPAGWDEVIADAESKLRELSRRRIAIKASIRAFRDRQRRGESLPEGLEEFRISPSSASGLSCARGSDVVA